MAMDTPATLLLLVKHPNALKLTVNSLEIALAILSATSSAIAMGPALVVAKTRAEKVDIYATPGLLVATVLVLLIQTKRNSTN